MNDLRAIAFYLPQFHPVPENDEWWGKGFTEWRNVAKAKPLFPGHYQPHLPADMGYYDLRLPEVREAQADLAREYGIHGFCYYHYWFNGRRILERPFNEVLGSGKPDLPFCLCWANENWTRVWDGGERNVLLEQHYSHEDDLAHIRSLIPAFKDPRYIRVNGKPLFLVYRTGVLPNPLRTTEIWREVAREAGIEDLYLVRVESHGDSTNPTEIGFDASVEFAPSSGLDISALFRGRIYRLLAKAGIFPAGLVDHNIYEYRKVVHSMMNRPVPDFTRFHCVTPGWDNTARREANGTVLIDSTPETYKSWLKTVAQRTREKFQGDEQICFINAWNEWAEGNHLEPDLRWGHAYLEATRSALVSTSSSQGVVDAAAKDSKEPLFKRLYWRLTSAFRSNETKRLLRYIGLPCMRKQASNNSFSGRGKQ